MKWLAAIAAVKILVLQMLIAPSAIAQSWIAEDPLLRRIGQKLESRNLSEGRSLYVSYVSFMDGVSESQALSERGQLISDAVEDNLKLIADLFEPIKLSDPQHTVPNNDVNVQRLVSITFDPSKSQDGKYRQIVLELMDPHSVDILMSGLIIDTGTVIQVHPIWISKPDNLIKTRDLQYSNRDELFQRVNESLALTPKAYDELRKTFLEFLR